MIVYRLAIGQPREVISTDSDVTVFSIDGKHACVIVECESGLVTVTMAGEPEFAAKAKSYGFVPPTESRI